jgi:hypothetical protein
MKRLWNPALVLFFLSPMCGELLSGSQPPLEFFRPVNLLFISAFYGSGALLAREITRRWGKGWTSLLLLGAAYGVAEEGVAVKSFFDPGWMDLGNLSVYGRWLGVNWIWMIQLTLFHAVFSIAIPVLLTERLFPERRAQTWLGRRGVVAASIVFAGLVLFMHFAISLYRVPWTHLVVTAGVLVGLAAWARHALGTPVRRQAGRTPSTWRCAWLGFLSTCALFLLSWVVPMTPVPASITALAMLALAAWTYRRAARLAGTDGWTSRHILALAAGGLSFFFLLAPLIELDTTMADDRRGMTLVALAFAAGLWLIDRRLRRASDPADSMAVPNPSLPASPTDPAA